MSSKTLKSLFAHKTWANVELFATLSSLPPEQSDHLLACLRILNHAHIVDQIFRAHLIGEQNTFVTTNAAEFPNREVLATAVAETDRWYQQYVDQASPQTLAELVSFTFTSGSCGRMNREEILLHIVTHCVYHRGGVAQILKSISVAPPDDPYTVFLHQTEPHRRGADD
jgi:uncharacterized damage-inducible protein DinB